MSDTRTGNLPIRVRMPGATLMLNRDSGRFLCPAALRYPKKAGTLFRHLRRILGLNRVRLRGSCGGKEDLTPGATAQSTEN